MDEKIAQRDQEILREVEKSVDAATEEVLDAVDGADTAGNASAAVYQEVTLSAGQVLYGSAGCEVMLRGGSATCVSAGKSTRDWWILPAAVPSTTAPPFRPTTSIP